MTKTMDRVKKDEDRQAKSLEELEQGAADIAERKKEAAGKSPSPRTDTALMIQRHSESRAKQRERVCRKPIWTLIGTCELVHSLFPQSIS
jgi:hypothetical protein